jgi:starch-binding outer membrane protein, SusD/RagB family
MHRPRSILKTLVAAGVMSLAACGDLTVPDFNNGQLDDLETSPTPTAIRQAVQGMVFGARSYMGAQNGYISLLGILGRESYNFDPADTRFITEMLEGPLDPGSPAFGANLWTLRYANIRLGNTILVALPSVSLLTDPEKEGVRGVVKTIQAHDLLMVLNTRDDLGAPIDIPVDPVADPAPIATKPAVQARIVQLLNEALVHLQSPNVSFPFSLGTGFAGFNTPATFAQFNRALKARVDVYMGQYATALTSLGGSFIDPNASLDLGVYHTHSTRSGDVDNQIFDPNGRAILAHPSIVTDAQTQPGGAPDARLTRKVATLPAPRTVQGITTDRLFRIYNSPDAPIPIIRNEELILLRAEANIGLNTPASLAAALTDINTIRTTSGGLAPRGPFATQAEALDELLYNKRYSLLFEGGHRWIDLRRYGRLGTLPLAVATHTIPSRFPFPEAECLARPAAAPPACP